MPKRIIVAAFQSMKNPPSPARIWKNKIPLYLFYYITDFFFFAPLFRARVPSHNNNNNIRSLTLEKINLQAMIGK